MSESRSCCTTKSSARFLCESGSCCFDPVPSSCVRLDPVDPVPGFPAVSACIWQQQHEGSGKQKHYGCLSVSYSGNTVLQLKSNDIKPPKSSACPAPRYFNSVRGPGHEGPRAFLGPRPSFWKFSPAVTGKSFCLISLGTA